MDFRQKWNDCLAVIKDIIPEAVFDTWFKPIVPLSYDIENHKLTILVPTHYFYERLEKEYAHVLGLVLNREYGEGVSLNYLIGTVDMLVGSGGPETPKKQGGIKEPPVDGRKVPGTDLDSNLTSKYRFDNFYEGESNKVVRSVAEQIAQEPGKMFNPFFIYGPSGVGKTHICNAIGLKIKKLYPKKRVLYVSANEFLMQFAEATLQNKRPEFLSFYQSIEVLIIDDLHEFIGKPKTQDTFFQIFNNLYLLGRHLIMTCDRAPVDLHGMEERLISRIKSGMTAAIERPDLELRRKILQKKILIEGLDISEEVFNFITENVIENVRDMEGVLASLMAHSVAMNHDVDMDLARQIVKQIVRLEKKQLTIPRILSVVCQYFNLDEALIQTKSRKREIVLARQITMFLAKRYTSTSFAHIGKIVGGRDHATVLHACKTVKDQLEINRSFRATMEEIEECLKK